MTESPTSRELEPEPPPSPPTAPLRFTSGSATDVGLRRATNEDSLLAEHPLYIVADGMGGHHAGEVASALAVESFAGMVGAPSVTPADVRRAFDAAAIAIGSIDSGSSRRAGTTLTGVAVSEVDGVAHWLIFNLGDSRTYRVADGALEQVTVDHSVVQELVDEGEIDRAAAAAHPGRNIVTRALGAGGVYRPDYWLLPIAAGDRMLVCSDGVSGELDDEALLGILAAGADPQEVAVQLVDAALLRGGRDNLTAIVVDAVAVPEASRAGAGAAEEGHRAPEL